MENLIEDWKKRKEEVHASNKKTVQKISKLNEKKMNQLAEGIHDAVFEKIDCLDCANCCKSIPPILNDTDIKRVAKYLGLKVSKFEEEYIRTDEDYDRIMKKSPCTFLGIDNKCDIYEVRPKACREYPHTNNYEFIKNTKLHVINAEYCPGVFHILSELKKVI